MQVTFLSNANSLHLKEWAEYLVRELGHRATVLTIPRPELPYEGVRVVHLASRPWLERKPAWPLLLPRLRRVLREERTDVLVGYRVVSYGFLAALAGFHPLVLAGQGGYLVWPPDRKFGRFCARYALRHADLLHAWSGNIRDSMLRLGADPGRILVLSRGVDLDFFRPGDRRREGPPWRIVMTRSLTPIYNTIQLVRAMVHVRREVPDVECHVVGDGPLRGELERTARELGVDDVVLFRGRLGREALRDLLQEAHVYVSTSISDGLPLSHIEAMACGLFPVCTDIPVNRYLVRDGETGLLAPVGDDAALGRALVRALRDRDLRERAVRENLAMVSREHDRHRNMRTMVAHWERLASR